MEAIKMVTVVITNSEALRCAYLLLGMADVVAPVAVLDAVRDLELSSAPATMPRSVSELDATARRAVYDLRRAVAQWLTENPRACRAQLGAALAQ